MTTFMNLMVVLVPFLLITAVFSRITIVELSLPSDGGGAASTEREIHVEVIVRNDQLQVSNGSAILKTLPMISDDYDLAGLSEVVIALKQQYPEKNDASVLLEPDIEYDHLIRVMDVVRSASRPSEDPEAEPERYALFADISIGDAP